MNHRVDGEGLLGAAVANNAWWCDAVCRAHGFAGVFSARWWVSARHELTFYPNVITLRPDVTAGETATTSTRPARAGAGPSARSGSGRAAPHHDQPATGRTVAACRLARSR